MFSGFPRLEGGKVVPLPPSTELGFPSKRVLCPFSG